MTLDDGRREDRHDVCTDGQTDGHIVKTAIFFICGRDLARQQLCVTKNVFNITPFWKMITLFLTFIFKHFFFSNIF